MLGTSGPGSASRVPAQVLSLVAVVAKAVSALTTPVPEVNTAVEGLSVVLAEITSDRFYEEFTNKAKSLSLKVRCGPRGALPRPAHGIPRLFMAPVSAPPPSPTIPLPFPPPHVSLPSYHPASWWAPGS
jgi:hypothetical protein